MSSSTQAADAARALDDQIKALQRETEAKIAALKAQKQDVVDGGIKKTAEDILEPAVRKNLEAQGLKDDALKTAVQQQMKTYEDQGLTKLAGNDGLNPALKERDRLNDNTAAREDLNKAIERLAKAAATGSHEDLDKDRARIEAELKAQSSDAGRATSGQQPLTTDEVKRLTAMRTTAAEEIEKSQGDRLKHQLSAISLQDAEKANLTAQGVQNVDTALKEAMKPLEALNTDAMKAKTAELSANTAAREQLNAALKEYAEKMGFEVKALQAQEQATLKDTKAIEARVAQMAEFNKDLDALKPAIEANLKAKGVPPEDLAARTNAELQKMAVGKTDAQLDATVKEIEKDTKAREALNVARDEFAKSTGMSDTAKAELQAKQATLTTKQVEDQTKTYKDSVAGMAASKVIIDAKNAEHDGAHKKMDAAIDEYAKFVEMDKTVAEKMKKDSGNLSTADMQAKTAEMEQRKAAAEQFWKELVKREGEEKANTAKKALGEWEAQSKESGSAVDQMKKGTMSASAIKEATASMPSSEELRINDGVRKGVDEVKKALAERPAQPAEATKSGGVVEAGTAISGVAEDGRKVNIKENEEGQKIVTYAKGKDAGKEVKAGTQVILTETTNKPGETVQKTYKMSNDGVAVPQTPTAADAGKSAAK
jgi:hypothetical protein